MKHKLLAFLSTVLAVILLSACSKNREVPCPVCHEINLSPKLTPQKNEYKIGDTLMLILNVPFIQAHPQHFRTVNLADFQPGNMPLLFIYYESDATKTYFTRRSGYAVSQYEVFTGQDKGDFGFSQEYGKYFQPERKSESYELCLRIILRQEGYFSIGSRYGDFKTTNSQECFSAAFLFDTANNNNFIRPILGYETTNWQEDFYFRVIP